MKTTWPKKAQKAHRVKWVAALRSGEYAQTSYALTNGKGFCCLGVACEISGLGHWEDGPNGEWVYAVGDDKHHELLPLPVKNWLGLGTDEGAFNPDGWGEETLANLNDAGKRFVSIAKIIESEPEGLVK